MKKKDSSIAGVGNIICVVVLLAMVAITFVNVCSRYLLHSSIAASEEITTNLFVVLSLVGAALALRDHSHIGLNIFVDKLSPRGKLYAKLFEGCVGIFFMGFLTYYGAARVLQQYGNGMISPGLAMPMWIYGTLCLIGFVILLVTFGEILVKAIKGLVNYSGSTDDAKEGSK